MVIVLWVGAAVKLWPCRFSMMVHFICRCRWILSNRAEMAWGPRRGFRRSTLFMRGECILKLLIWQIVNFY